MQSIGGYASLIRTAAITGDTSMLRPMSVRDLIWLQYELSEKRKDDNEYETSKMKMLNDLFEQTTAYILDLRSELQSIDAYVKLAALKGGTKKAKIEPIDVEKLPSTSIFKAIKEEKDKTSRKGKQKKHYSSYQDYLDAEESDEKTTIEKDRLVVKAKILSKHVDDLIAMQGGFKNKQESMQAEQDDKTAT